MLNFRRFVHKGSQYANLFPEKLFKKKQRSPAQFYVAEDQLADQIDQALKPFIQQTQCETAVEINPGIGLFTRRLLNRDDRFHKILLYEPMEHFLPGLHDLHALYPERVKVKHGDFVGLPKLAFQDKIDNGTRVMDLLCDLPMRPFQDEPNAVLFGAVGCYNFFKSLINSLIFQNGWANWGRLEMYLAIPPPIYIHLTCRNEIGYLFYRSTSILFQILFEHRFITQLPREHFLPKPIGNNSSKGSKLVKVNSINAEYLYLVRIVPRRNLYDLCPVADLQALWYFIKQNCISRRNRIIPNLEKFVPGCGPRLIINNAIPEIVRPMYPDDKPLTELPQYSTQCTTMTNRDYYPGINIYTQFGDLSPSQMLTLFTQFRHWPEYEQSSFLASLENNLLKMDAASDEGGTAITEEDDEPSESASEEENILVESTEPEVGEVKPKKRKRKTQK